ncbi:MAG: hypothetical protein E6R03_09085 [Hyphomicrobiaceae bacterium]|nr:MAG: hypothetical protein E6R03_09085 [Hyphomicrobiaceae bacterium]
MSAQLDWNSCRDRASHMSREELIYAISDCYSAAKSARLMEAFGGKVLKSEGYYMDELSVYRQELNSR